MAHRPEGAQGTQKLEVKAAKAWYKTLSPVQREVFDKLVDNHDGLMYLRLRRRAETADDEEAH